MPNRLSKGKVLVRAINVDGTLTSPTSSAAEYADVTLTNTNMLNLRATPITLVAAPGAGKVLQFLGAQLFFDYTAAYTETSDDLAVKFTNGSGAAASTTLDGTGFVTATADAYALMTPAQGLATPNAALVLHNTGDGEFGGGNASNVVKVRTYYRTLNVLS